MSLECEWQWQMEGDSRQVRRKGVNSKNFGHLHRNLHFFDSEFITPSKSSLKFRYAIGEIQELTFIQTLGIQARPRGRACMPSRH